MMNHLAFSLCSAGHELDLSSNAWGELEDSSSRRNDPAALRDSLQENGYLFLRAFFSRELIETARLALLEHLQPAGVFDPGVELRRGQLLPGIVPPTLPHDQLHLIPDVQRVVFGPELAAFYQGILGGAVKHFDHIWGRAMGRGQGTQSHCDIVYMGRGTRNLFTAWIPYGDVTYEIGGLMILEKSHRQADRMKKYLHSDVDTYCENNPDRHGWKFNGALSTNAASLRQKLGGRWLSAEFRMGDLLTFGMETVHGSIDNQTDRIRLSTDTRYQLAADPIDERWVGESPIGHGPEAKVGVIC